MRQLAKFLHRIIVPISDPRRAIRGFREFPRYFADWRQYASSPGAEPLRLRDAYPQLHDRTTASEIDTHYFHTNGWAMRRILAQKPPLHVDIGSQTMFVNLLSSVVSTFFVDYRPLTTRLDGLYNVRGDILELPFADGSMESLSCLHVAEHIGLGRYGDPLNPFGTLRACSELQRVLASGGNLFFVVPVGRSQVCFNAHRVHPPATIRQYFDDLDLIEFSGVSDEGKYFENVEFEQLSHDRYACGMFWFRRS